jgi:4-hydroxy-3-methylbut-2-en-1-yl diphosphate reductase
MKIFIDQGSGCCFGVVSAIDSAEELLKKHNPLYCLGDIVHNNKELERLSNKGLTYINYETFRSLKNTAVLIRAHGEPPSTYQTALDNNISLIDASCPVVLRLQANIRKAYDYCKENGGQIVIFGKEGHAEVIGLRGQTFDQAIIVSNMNDLQKIDYQSDVWLFAQTTQDASAYSLIGQKIMEHQQVANPLQPAKLFSHNTICRLVANRADELTVFSQSHDVILFVSDPKSSNGKYLFDICKKHNNNSFFISSFEDIDISHLKDAASIGICGATSTPRWLMQDISNKLNSLE